MSRSGSTPTPVPLILTPAAANRCLTDKRIELASQTRFALGLSGVTAIEVSALDVCHVSLDGEQPYSIIVVPNRDARRADLGPTRRQPIGERARWLLGCHLHERRNRCAHHRTLMRTFSDGEGVVRCANCKERHDFMRVPLFDSRESERMSVSAIREDFRRVRDMLGLDKGLTFDSLRETHLATLLGGGGPGKRAA